MDIKGNKPYPAGELSNFSPFAFEIDGVQCNSMEGFLQSLKFADPNQQKEVCMLVGYAAKKAGKGKNWQDTQTLWWRGKPFKRDSQQYQDLLDWAYMELRKNKDFQKALLDSGNELLTHSIGKSDITQTVLTEHEFCSRLMYLRQSLKT